MYLVHYEHQSDTSVVEPVIADLHGVVHRVYNVRIVQECYQTYGYAENWQVKAVCKPYKAVTVTLELHTRDIDRAVLGDESRGDVVTCLACVCGINIREF
jgi:hypothetical protein